MIEVELTEAEWEYAAMIGVRRQIQAITKGFRADALGCNSPRDGMQLNIMGACGEMVVAKWLGIPWDGGGDDISKRHHGDVGGLLEVRTTHSHDYPLRLNANDKPERIYMLVTGMGPTWQIQGFAKAAGVMRQEWFHDRPPPVGRSTGCPAFWVTQENLRHDLHKLKEWFLSKQQPTTGTRRTA